MAITGIDAQHMITRAADYTKDASVLQRRNELTQDYMAVQQRADDAQEKQMVLKSPAKENVKLRPDDRDGGGGAGARQSGAKKGGKNEDGDAAKPAQIVISEERLIDIKI